MPSSISAFSAVSWAASPMHIEMVTPPKPRRWPQLLDFIRCSLKWPSAVFMVTLVIHTCSSGSTVLPRACFITSPTLKSSK